MTVAENHSLLLEAFSSIPDRQERLSAIVERGRRGLPYPTDRKTPAYRVTGCVSPVWLCPEPTIDGPFLTFRAEAEALVVKGLVRLLCELYENTLPSDIVATEPHLLEELDLLRDLSLTRRNGLDAVRARIREIASLHLGPR